jgi:phosphatidylglycerol:prolipoprotein diacylglycerol transferase
LPFPDFDPVLVHIGPFAIRWYALAYIAGILLGWRYALSLARNSQLWPLRGPIATSEQIDDLVLWITLGVIIGGRLGHVFFYTPGLVLEDPLEIFKTWHGGMSYHGGMIGVLIAVALFVRANAAKAPLDLLRLGDLICAVVPIGLFFGRIANFINGELWGRPTSLPWGIIFPAADGIMPRHPSQLYEAALEGMVLFLILRWATHSAKLMNRRGVVAGLYFAFYGLFRMALENVREPDSYMPHFPLGLTRGIMLSVPMVLFGGWLIWRGLNEPLPEADPDTALQTATADPAVAEAVAGETAEDPFKIRSDGAA